MQLSNDFSLEELTKSQMADRMGIDNTPPPVAVVYLQSLVDNVLQPLRDAVGQPISINSGYRNPTVNAAVGGVPSSQHTEGKAADTECMTMTTVEWARFIVSTGIEFDQLILEFYSRDKGPNSGWVHISYNPGQNRHQVLTAVNKNGTVYYMTGIIE